MRVATWNLENLFAPTIDATTITTQEAYDAKLATLTATIAALAPDVLAVQEVGPPPAITDLATALGIPMSAGHGRVVEFVSILLASFPAA